LIAEIDDELRKLIPLTGYKLHTMPGIDLVTEAQIISEIGILTASRLRQAGSVYGLAPCNSALPERVKTKDAGMQQGTKCDISLSRNPDGSSIGVRKAKTPGIQGVF